MSSQESSSIVLPKISDRAGRQELRKAQVGEILFANCLPITWPLEQGLVSIDGDITFGTPNALNKLFASNKLDAGAMSSFYYLANPHLQLMPAISIACTGAVGSVLFFSKCAPSELLKAQGRILGSAQSATSVNLLRVLMHHHYQYDIPLTSEETPDIEEDGAVGALVIGDRALEIDERWSQKYHRIDLAQWWVETFNLPMVFGVWAATRDWASERPQEFARMVDAHVEARDMGMGSHFDTILAEAVTRTGLSKERLRHYYFNELDFSFTAEHSRGMELYFKLCADLNLL